jgi:hypothetical protein
VSLAGVGSAAVGRGRCWPWLRGGELVEGVPAASWSWRYPSPSRNSGEAGLLYFATDKHDLKTGEPLVLVECKRLIKDEKELQAAAAQAHSYPLLVIDEVGYIPFEPEAANLFFQLVSARYERASLMVTSNKPFGRWARSSATK